MSGFKSKGRRVLEEVLTYHGDDCLAWPLGRTRDGYGQVWMDGKMKRAHRVVCEEAHGPPPTLQHEAAHSCGNGHLGCVARAHLSWKTRAENQADRVVHDTHNRGERNGNAKLTTADICQIRVLATTVTQRELAKRFCVAPSLIHRIISRESWAWLSET